MKKLIYLLFFSFLTSCSSFSEYSKETKKGFDEEDRTMVSNEAANLKTITFGDFKFATSQKEFRKLNKQKPQFKEILFYAKTTDVPYEYYVLHNPKEVIKNESFTYKDTIIGNSRFVIAVSKNAPRQDSEFIKKMVLSLR
ncbi:hypothetical protein [Flavobacterium sp.]|uniref:hypothetical protein n=1 Tax=Flavobacterium sp. TaxID=239 RepID=UPI0028BEFF4C|nr:hypothetical protein [Flavobacterium sp.]